MSLQQTSTTYAKCYYALAPSAILHAAISIIKGSTWLALRTWAWASLVISLSSSRLLSSVKKHHPDSSISFSKSMVFVMKWKAFKNPWTSVAMFCYISSFHLISFPSSQPIFVTTCGVERFEENGCFFQEKKKRLDAINAVSITDILFSLWEASLEQTMSLYKVSPLKMRQRLWEYTGVTPSSVASTELCDW